MGDIFEYNGNIYRITKQIAQGGMSIIYLLEANNFGPEPQAIILKYLLNCKYDLLDVNAKSCEFYFNQETTNLEIQNNSTFPHLEYYGCTHSSDFEIPEYYILMEYIPGSDLELWFHNQFHHLPNTNNDLLMIIDQIIAPILNHMNYCHHQGIIHRDLSPNNIVITIKQGKVTPIVIDWGVSKRIINDSPNTNTYQENLQLSLNHSTSISNRNTAPEIRNGSQVGFYSDIYMLGSLIHFCLTGFISKTLPSTQSDYILSPKTQNPAIPEKLNDLIVSMTQYDPNKRIQSLDAVIVELNSIYHEIQTDCSTIKTAFLPIEALLQKRFIICLDMSQNMSSKMNLTPDLIKYLELEKEQIGLLIPQLEIELTSYLNKNNSILKFSR